MKKKRCSKCKVEKTLTEFYPSKYTKNGCRSCCKSCSKKDNDRTSEARRGWHMKKRYSLTLKGYNEKLKQQNYSCAICGKKEKVKDRRTKNPISLAVDHNHKTKFIRGLLCNFCNRCLLRHLRDNKNRAIGLVIYLTKAIKNDKNWEV